VTELTLESLATRQPGASFLRTAAGLAIFVWLAAVVFEAWAMWSQYSDFPTSSGLGSGDASRTDLAVRTLAATLNSTWATPSSQWAPPAQR